MLDVSADLKTDRESNGSYYEARLQLNPPPELTRRFRVTPGMPVEASIDSGVRRTFLSYLIEPVSAYDRSRPVMRVAWRPALAILASGAPVATAVSPTSVSQCLTMTATTSRAQSADPRAGRAGAFAARALAEAKAERGTALPQVQAFNRSGVGDGIRADNQFDVRVGLQFSQRVIDLVAARCVAAPPTRARKPRRSTLQRRASPPPTRPDAA